MRRSVALPSVRITLPARLLVDQLREFPQSPHDGPDALELAVHTLELLINPQ